MRDDGIVTALMIAVEKVTKSPGPKTAGNIQASHILVLLPALVVPILSSNVCIASFRFPLPLNSDWTVSGVVGEERMRGLCQQLAPAV